jgi:hypothetical protein
MISLNLQSHQMGMRDSVGENCSQNRYANQNKNKQLYLLQNKTKPITLNSPKKARRNLCLMPIIKLNNTL